MKIHAFPLQLAQEAILLGLYSDAIELLRPLSEDDNNPDAQFLHAYLHFWDDNLSREQALDHMTYLANSGHAEANYILATCPDLSPGYKFSLPQRNEQLNHLKTAADLGSIYALTDLAQCHIEGIVTNPNLVNARQLLEQVSDQDYSIRGYPKAYLLLAKLLIADNRLEQDLETGLRYIARASSGEHDRYVSIALQYALELLNQPGRLSPDLRVAVQELLDRTPDKMNLFHHPQWKSYLRHYCRFNIKYDLYNAGFDTFTDFVFDHYPVYWQDEKHLRWDEFADIRFNARQLVHYYTELFQNPAFLVERFSEEQIKQGLRMDRIPGRTIYRILDTPEIIPQDIENFIRSMSGLFEQLFTDMTYGGLCFMWWEVGFGDCGGRNSVSGKLNFNDADRQGIRRAELETMIKIITLEPLPIQQSAIHGFGHSPYPEKEPILRQYLEDNPEHPAWIREYALAAIEGKIM